jgi:molybdopterin synthase catalytic subunit
MEEAFGGLVRKEGFDAKELLDRLEFDHTDPFDENYVKEIIADIREAIPETVGA